MSRRKQSVFDDLIDIAARLPWWAGIVLAVTSYFGLHRLAIMEVAAPIGTKGMGTFVGMQLYKTFATYLQYIVPALFLVGSLVSALGARKRHALHAKVGGSGARSALEDMSWQEFEQLVGEYFRRKGFAIEETGGWGADGGVDLLLRRGSDRYLVQCKQWRARQVGVTTVRELYGVIAAKGAAGGFVVTSGVFTDEAKRFAEGREIELIGGDELAQMISAQHARAGSESGVRGSRNWIEPSVRKDAAPLCPQCGSVMVMKTARKGRNAGSNFWGCPTYPKCRGTRPAEG